MAGNKVYITLEVDDKGSAVIRRMGNKTDQAFDKMKAKAASASTGMGSSLQKLKKHWMAVTAAMAAVIYVAKKTMDSFTEAASTSEQLNVRLQHLLGSVEEGNKLFKEMGDYAGRVPFEYREIMESATALAGVMKGGVGEIKQWMPLIGDLAAVTGLSIQDTTSQVIRMYSAGAASADMFRERGVLAMLGFQAGVSYSAEETRKIMMESWNKAGSQFKGATDDLGTTWKGIMSMFSDMWFAFRNMVMDNDVFVYMKTGAGELLKQIKTLKKQGNLDVWAKEMAEGMITAFKAMVLSVTKIIDVWNRLKILWNLVASGFQTVISVFMTGVAKLYKVKAWLDEHILMNKELAEVERGLANQAQNFANEYSDAANRNAEDAALLAGEFNNLTENTKAWFDELEKTIEAEKEASASTDILSEKINSSTNIIDKNAQAIKEMTTEWNAWMESTGTTYLAEDEYTKWLKDTVDGLNKIVDEAEKTGKISDVSGFHQS